MAETCSDEIQNQDETCADVGGVCGGFESGAELSCVDGKDNDCDGNTDSTDGDCSVSACAAADVNGDLAVDVNDLVYVAHGFAGSDMTGDGNSDIFDLVYVAVRIGCS